ncbi:MAG: PEP-CTERM sorting domain-containing protein, partial [Pirellulales bacterium]|nr:PEP-CTERM sorting domain-containing protein [Pirellulales bacterium]
DLNVTAGTFTTTDPSKEFVVSATRPKTYISEGNPITVNYTGKGVLSVGGTGQVTIASPITLTKDVDDVDEVVGYDKAGIVNVGMGGNPGGTLTVPGIQLGGSAGTNDGMVNFHGGTLVASSDSLDFVQVLSRVWPEGAKIDTNGHDVTMNRSLLAPWGVGVESIAVTDGGAGYIGTPVVSFSGGGSGATGYAVMADDGAGGLMVDHIVVTNPGVGYTSVPTVSLLGGGMATPATVGEVFLNAHNESGDFEKLGEGTLTVTGNMTFTGDNTITEGDLVVYGDLSYTGTTTIGSDCSFQVFTPDTAYTPTLGNIVGPGDLYVGDGVNSTSLTATSIQVGTLTIGAPPTAAATGLHSVPEPSTAMLLLLAGCALFLAARRNGK